MLRDTPIHPVKNDLPRKWLIDDHLELILWYRPGGDIAGFELVYDRHLIPHSVRWLPGSGTKHYQVDMGEDNPGKNRSPMLLANGPLTGNNLLREFEERSRELPQEIRELVLEKLRELIQPD